MVFGLLKGLEEGSRLEELRKKLNPARLRGEKTCVKCGFCCNVRTCIPTPKELNEIAKFLGLKPIELINKFYAIDKRGETYFVKPVGENIKDLAGQWIPDDRTYNEGPCIFLKNNLCEIHKVKPKTAIVMNCWEEDNKKGDEQLDNTLKSWKDNLKKLYNIDGKELEAEEDEDWEDD